MDSDSIEIDDTAYQKQREKRKRKLVLRAVLIGFIDFVLIGAGLLIFAYFHHVAPIEQQVQAVVLPTPTAAPTEMPTPAPTETPELTDTIAPTPTPYVDQGMWGAKFADKFTDGEIIKTDGGYQSEDISITLEQVSEDGITYYVADIYVRNLWNFRTAMAGGEYGGVRTAKSLTMAKENDAILAVSGDYYRARADGIVVRNGMLYRDDLYEDVLMMYYDGSMQTFSADAFDVDAMVANGAYQGWSFGPMLLSGGQPIEKFNSSVSGKNPRCGIGYYEPGHYCFVLVDGRQAGYSRGMTLAEFSQLFYDLGCSVAYNMDGGYSASMVYDGELESHPAKGGRNISDIIYIAEVTE